VNHCSSISAAASVSTSACCVLLISAKHRYIVALDQAFEKAFGVMGYLLRVTIQIEWDTDHQSLRLPVAYGSINLFPVGSAAAVCNHTQRSGCAQQRVTNAHAYAHCAVVKAQVIACLQRGFVRQLVQARPDWPTTRFKSTPSRPPTAARI